MRGASLLVAGTFGALLLCGAGPAPGVAGVAVAPWAALTSAEAQWLAAPNADDVDALFPTKARRESVSGFAEVACLVQADGRLRDCSVVSETPPDYGFGPATVKAASRFRMRSFTRKGAPVAGATVTIPMHWTP